MKRGHFAFERTSTTMARFNIEVEYKVIEYKGRCPRRSCRCCLNFLLLLGSELLSALSTICLVALCTGVRLLRTRLAAYFSGGSSSQHFRTLEFSQVSAWLPHSDYFALAASQTNLVHVDISLFV